MEIRSLDNLKDLLELKGYSFPYIFSFFMKHNLLNIVIFNPYEDISVQIEKHSKEFNINLSNAYIEYNFLKGV